jgi:Double zinc ribbon
MSDRDRELRPNAAGSNPDGAAPYRQHPGDTLQCQNCALFNQDDAQFCRECGYGLSPAALAGHVDKQAPDNPQPWETLQCPSCGRMAAPDSVFCDQCGCAIPSSAYAGQANGATDIGGAPCRAAAGGRTRPCGSALSSWHRWKLPDVRPRHLMA